MSSDPSESGLSVAQITGQRIAAARKRRGMSQAALAAQMNVGQSTVADWERGKTRPRSHTWQKLASVLGTRVPALMPDVDDEWAREGMDERLGVVDGGQAWKSSLHAFALLYDGLVSLMERYPALRYIETNIDEKISPADFRRNATLSAFYMWTLIFSAKSETSQADQVLEYLERLEVTCQAIEAAGPRKDLEAAVLEAHRAAWKKKKPVE